MPIPAGSTLPEEPKMTPLPADVYEVDIEDIDEEIKPSPWKNEDGSDQPDIHQFKIIMNVQDDPFNGRKIISWVRASLRTGTKSKRPTLPQFLLAVTGESFGTEDRSKITADFLNSLIGGKLRVSTQIEKAKNSDNEYTVVTSFLPSKRAA